MRSTGHAGVALSAAVAERGASLEHSAHSCMAIMLICGALVLLGLVLVAAWGATEPAARPTIDDDRFATHATLVARRFSAGIAGGLGAGLLVAGAGGRLAMRLLAVTAGDGAQGKLTEAEQRVGVISTGGTIALIIFGGLLFGLASGFAYLVVRRWLPRGRLGGVAFGLLLLVLAASRVEPLRPSNEDFDIVGPGWVALVSFVALVVVHGMLVAAITNRWERAAPRLEGRFVGYVPILLLAPFVPLLVIALLAGVVIAALSTQRAAAEALASPLSIKLGRIALALVTVVALPFTMADFANIVGRGPL